MSGGQEGLGSLDPTVPLLKGPCGLPYRTKTVRSQTMQHVFPGCYLQKQAWSHCF